jgi:LysR family glycine cleavage system transcriptional activator
MARLLPPLNPLRMFEVAARHVSFTRAAAELGVTQAAVSRQVAVLESWMKVKLFERLHSELRLTEAGVRYLARIQGAFDSIDVATRETRRDRARRSLRIRACATFAKHWLIPRLPAFHAAYPEIEINLTTSVAAASFDTPDLHAAIRFGNGRWEGRTARKVFADSLAPLYNPLLLEDDRPLCRVEDVLRYPVLQSRYRQSDWLDWASFAGVQLDRRQFMAYESSSLSYQAAEQGLGIAMGQLRLLEPELALGALVLPFDCVLGRPLGYYILEPEGVPVDPRLVRFREWVLDESAAERQEPMRPSVGPSRAARRIAVA